MSLSFEILYFRCFHFSPRHIRDKVNDHLADSCVAALSNHTRKGAAARHVSGKLFADFTSELVKDDFI